MNHLFPPVFEPPFHLPSFAKQAKQASCLLLRCSRREKLFVFKRFRKSLKESTQVSRGEKTRLQKSCPCLVFETKLYNQWHYHDDQETFCSGCSLRQHLKGGVRGTNNMHAIHALLLRRVISCSLELFTFRTRLFKCCVLLLNLIMTTNPSPALNDTSIASCL